MFVLFIYFYRKIPHSRVATLYLWNCLVDTLFCFHMLHHKNWNIEDVNRGYSISTHLCFFSRRCDYQLYQLVECSAAQKKFERRCKWCVCLYARVCWSKWDKSNRWAFMTKQHKCLICAFKIAHIHVAVKFSACLFLLLLFFFACASACVCVSGCVYHYDTFLLPWFVPLVCTKPPLSCR